MILYKTNEYHMRCPGCNSTEIIKRGKRQGKFVCKQLYFCKNCGKRFADQSLKYKIHSPRVIYHALNYYNLGHTLDESSKLVNRQFKIRTGKSTIHSWITEFRNLCPISKARSFFSDYNHVLFTKRFEHENLDYEFMYHKYKLDVLCRNKFPGLFQYITRFEQGCPDVFFEIGERCSQPKFKVTVNARKKKNLACTMTEFATKAARNNYERHKMVETFMLINDKATIAIEVPAWYWEKNIDNGVTGHIDLLQVRNDHVYILDYKPDASKDKKAPWQLYHYALALSFRTRIPLRNIVCAWFDKEIYYEYKPADVDTKLIGT